MRCTDCGSDLGEMALKVDGVVYCLVCGEKRIDEKMKRMKGNT